MTPMCAALLGACCLSAAANQFASVNDVRWTTLGKNENDSMPIGNGDLAANVWTEQNGDILLLAAKSDAWSETGKLDKLGRVRIHMTPNPFADASGFSQTLRLEDGSIEIRSKSGTVRVWVDANHPALHVEADLAQPTQLEAKLELWRTATHSYATPSPDRGGLFEFGNHAVPVDFEADTVMDGLKGRVVWYHFNTESIYALVLEKEHLQDVAAKFPDPLLHRCFGASLLGPDLVSKNSQVLQSTTARRHLQLDLVALTTPPAPAVSAWQAEIDRLVKAERGRQIGADRAASSLWWREFWDRSWIHVEGDEDAARVSQGYAMQRYMLAASSRGPFPAKFNGGLFTVGHDMPAGKDSTREEHNPDFRAWGSSYWNQNNRLLYWPLIATGDFDLLEPWFNLYVNALPMARERTRAYYHHDGAAYVETMYFWGLPNLNDFGWDNPSTELTSHYMRYHIQGVLEVIAQMLDVYDITQDPGFAREKLIPLADAALAYYDNHWPRGANGKLRIAPAQSLETYQVDAVNPTPDVAGLGHVARRLLNLPPALSTENQRKTWARLLADLPPIPIGTTTREGKLPRAMTQADPQGARTILPAEQYGPTHNAENPQLYTAFPYRVYGVGKPDLALAQSTFDARLFHMDHCWGQDGPQAAVLGLTSVAKKAVVDAFTDYGDQRFQWFWKAGGDWIPDLDDGGTGMIGLQLMIMQTDGKRITLLPAWPSDWTADFKLHAPSHTVVQGRVEHGKLVRLDVVPAARRKDVEISPR